MESSPDDSPPAELDAELPVRLRSYQQEMLEWSLKQNIIVAMDTGSGKTHIAIMRIAEELKYNPENGHAAEDKIVWFICPSVALCMQQHDVIAQHLPGYLVKTLVGSDGVDKWTTQELWDGFLLNTKVVVCTPQVLVDALTHGFVKIAGISLLVFDEAHRCIEGSPMNVIMEKFYHPAKKGGQSQVPAILGLSASPIISKKSSSLETLEANLDAKAITPKVHRGELEEYVHPPEIMRAQFRVSVAEEGAASPAFAALNRIFQSYDVTSDPWLQHLRGTNDPSYESQLHKQLLKPSTSTYKQLKTLHQRALYLYEQLGASATDWYIYSCVDKYMAVEVYQSLLFGDVEEQEKQYLQKILRQVQTSGSDNAIADRSIHITPRVLALAELLNQNEPNNTQAIIFVEQRATVSTLAHLLRSSDLISKSWSIGGFVGTSTFSKRQTALADLAEVKEQLQDLKDFRDGTKNIIIATSVLEEGIDIPACNLTVCFDLPKNLVSYIQRRGRARKRDSKYVLFISAQDCKSDPSKWEKIEAQMKQAYMDEARESTTAGADVQDDSMSDREYRVPATGALLTTSNAKAHLYHFCAVSSLHASRIVDLRPEFATTYDESDRAWTATVTLPSFVHPSLRTASSSRLFLSETTAIKDAAFEAYVMLHKEGLVNDNLLPLREDPQFEAIDQPSIIEVSELQNPWKQLVGGKREHLQWHATRLTISCSEHTLLSVTMWLPTVFEPVQPFKLYWNEDTTYIVEIEKDSDEIIPGDSTLLNRIRTFTHALLQSVHRAHMTTDQDFLVLFSPARLASNIGDAIEEVLQGGMLPINGVPSQHKGMMDHGIVRVRSQGLRAYLLRGIQQPDEDSEPQVLLSPFPKRKDFLHPVDHTDTGNAAYTGTHSFSVSDCEFDNLPAKYVILAAFVPSIIHRLSTTLMARNLQYSLSEGVQISNTSLVLEAISSPSAGEERDYNRPEFLGDTILKFCVSLQVMAQHLNWPEGYLTGAKGVIVSNNFLTKAALNAGLDRFVLTKIFTGKKWRPETIGTLLKAEESGIREVSSKVVADVVEALIGASYIDGGLDKAFSCIRTLLPDREWYSQAQSIDRLLSDVVQVEHLDLDRLQGLIGYEFTHEALLLNAVTHASSSAKTVTPSYERLEFLGDAILDLIIVPKLFAHKRRLRHWELHRIREALVNADFLGFCCMKFGMEEYLQDVIFDVSDVKQEHPKLQHSTRTVHLYDFMQAGPRILKPKAQSLLTFEKYRNVIEMALHSEKNYPWADLTAMHPQKFFSDLIESILGALFLDSSGDLSVCEAFVERLGILKVMNRILEEHVESANPKEQVGILADRQTVEYFQDTITRENGIREFVCTIRVGSEDVAVAGGCNSEDEAKIRAAVNAVRVLEGRVERDAKNGWSGTRKRKKLDLASLDVDEHAASDSDESDMDADGGVVLDDEE